jgi:RNA polymerase-binding transcription factor
MEVAMTQNEIRKFRWILEAAATDLVRATRQREAIAIENGGDELEKLIGASERELAVRTLESGSAKLKEIRAALRRIDEGTYGTCEECEDPISPRRLAALPSAALCIQCQEAADGNHAGRPARAVFAMAA